MDEDVKFTNRRNITGNGFSFYPKYSRIVFSKVWLESDDTKTKF